MNIKELNKKLEKFNETEQKDFKTILKEIMDKVEKGENSPEDLKVIKDFNNSIIKNPELSASIYQIILSQDSSVTTKLIDSLKGTQTYTNLIADESSLSQFYKELKNIFGMDFSIYNKVNIDLVSFVLNHSFNLNLVITKGKLQIKRLGKSRLGSTIYTSSSINDCLEFVKNKIIDTKNVFKINKDILFLVKDNPEVFYGEDSIENHIMDSAHTIYCEDTRKYLSPI